MQGAQHRGGMPMGAGALDGETGRRRQPLVVALEHGAQGFDLSWRPVGEIGQGALAGAGPLAPALAQEDGGARLAIGDGLYIHGNYITY